MLIWARVVEKVGLFYEAYIVSLLFYEIYDLDNLSDATAETGMARLVGEIWRTEETVVASSSRCGVGVSVGRDVGVGSSVGTGGGNGGGGPPLMQLAVGRTTRKWALEQVLLLHKQTVS